MDNKCMNCTETFPQTERIQNAASGRMYAMKELVPILKKIESGELATVVHGRWERIDTRYVEQFKCSVCRSECYVPTCMGEPMYDYCPSCGAKMEG